ncbi:MAG: phosphoenolpyruvate--protein phosphotransferase [bacterium]
MNTGPVVLQGHSISPGNALGRAEIRLEDPSIVPVYPLATDQDVERELQKLGEALGAADEELASDVEWAKTHLPETEAEIFVAQRAILKDPSLLDWVRDRIRGEKINAAAAVRHRFDDFRAVLQGSASELVRNRAADVSDAERVILSHLLGLPRRTGLPDASEPEGPSVVLVTNDPPPSLLARLDPGRVAGILCERGAGMGHVAVLARALELPALVQVEGLLAQVRDGDLIAIDADNGVATIHPEDGEIARVRAAVRQRSILRSVPSDPRAQRVTKDGVRIQLLGNATGPRDVDAAAQVAADGIGLFRTEVQYLASPRLPKEADLVRVYSSATCCFLDVPIDFRLLDLGSDKHLPGARLPSEPNPALGLRSLRLLFENPRILHTQVRAVLQAAADGPARLLLPMVSDPSDVRRVREVVQECHEELRREGLRHDPDLSVGAMIEHPAGVWMAPEILREADFVSVGTNDLTMYILSADREAAHLAGWYDPFHPAVLRALHRIAQAGAEAGKNVSICGEIAADPTMTGLLIGLGYTRLSMQPQWIVPVGSRLGQIDTREWKARVEELLQVDSGPEIRRRVREAERASEPS